MAENYGLPYTGSKSKIAHWVVDNLPCGRVLIDAFAGGCSITHRALLSKKWMTIIANDINRKYPQLFLDAVQGKYRDERRWISREDFERLKSQDAFVACCWSFSNNLKDYIYSKAIEPYKRALHYAIVFNDFAPMQEGARRRGGGCRGWRWSAPNTISFLTHWWMSPHKAECGA